MRTLFRDPTPSEVQELLERWRKWGGGRHDEVWEGVLHVANFEEARENTHHVIPPRSWEEQRVIEEIAGVLGPSAKAAGLESLIRELGLGEPGDYRVAAGALHRERPRGVWQPTAALVVEIVSPGDETWEKLEFYAAHDVDEVLIVDPEKRSVSWLGLAGGEYRPIERSSLIDLGPSELASQIDWPPTD
jgi:hypothetical protein